jgi:hypothetical protein
LDIPQRDVTEVSLSLYGLSLFSSKAGSHAEDNVVAMPSESLSVSVGELWPGVLIC